MTVDLFRDVCDFNREVLGLPTPCTPTLLSDQRHQWAVVALNEELDEFVDAHEAGDIVGEVDALVDLVYFALGRLYEMGVDANRAWDEVQRANMSKARGSLSKRPGSMGYDAVKPEGWRGPDHSWLLGPTFDEVLTWLTESARS